MNSTPHCCPYCGEWYDVERGQRRDEWFVCAHTTDLLLQEKVWSIVATAPVCPSDGTELKEFVVVTD